MLCPAVSDLVSVPPVIDLVSVPSDLLPASTSSVTTVQGTIIGTIVIIIIILGHTIEIAGVPRRSRVHTLYDQQ